jgi:two-component system OmpR family response regulator
MVGPEAWPRPLVLVVDDEPAIAELLAAALKVEGFEVETVGTGMAALERLERGGVGLVLLDVMLPDLEGTEVCRRLRDRGHELPVIYLTARDATEDKVAGLGAGGDDYVTKPFSLEELVARMRAQLRRAGALAPMGSRLVFEDLELDEDTHEVFRQGTPIELTATEFNLLRELILSARRVLSKYELLDRVWGPSFDGDPAIVETYISYLRKKVDVFEPPLIHTIRGVGYSLRLPRRRD